LKKVVSERDKEVSVAKSSKRKAEVEVEELRASLAETQKRLDAAKKVKGAEDGNEHNEMLRVRGKFTLPGPRHVLTLFG